MPKALTVLIAAALAGGVLARAQVPTFRGDRRLRSGVELTTVTATVRDADGHLVPGLPRDRFEVFEDGEAQPIAQFTSERVPVALGLLLDISDSMYGQRIEDARTAVRRFLGDLLAPEDSYFVMTFNHAPRVIAQWTGDAAIVGKALAAIRPSGGTAIYDAVMAALPLIEDRPRERAALVVISDGADNSSDTPLRDLRTALLRSDAFVYAIAIDSPKRQPINTRVNPEALGEISNPTGGQTTVVRDTADLADATARIAEELNSQYLFAYATPHPGDGKYHSIRVRVGGGAYRVRARNGYVSLPVHSRQ